MMKHEQQTSRREKSSNFFGGNNFSGLNLYKNCINLIGLLFLLKTGIGLPRISSLIIIMLLLGSRLCYCGANGAEKVSGVFLICV